jgi:hypothetical protein
MKARVDAVLPYLPWQRKKICATFAVPMLTPSWLSESHVWILLR